MITNGRQRLKYKLCMMNYEYKILCILFTITFLCACSDVSPEWKAASAAKDYYDCLKDGNAIGFLEGKVAIDSLPADYGEQMLKTVEQYQADLQQKHGGLREVRISEEHYSNTQESCRDSVLHLTYAFLILCFGDSTQEEITVPMVEHNGQWMMK